MDTQQARLGQQLKETNAFTAKSLLLGILASVVCTAIIPALGASVPATLAGAAISPVLVALFTTQGHGAVRSIGIGALSGIALVVSFGGFTLPEAIAGSGSLTGDRAGTFVNTERTRTTPPTEPQPSTSTPTPTRPPLPTPTLTHPALQVEMAQSRKCPSVKVGKSEACKRIGVRNVGKTTIHLDSDDLGGDQAGDFTITKACHGTLKPKKACSVRLIFQPTVVGIREAVLVVHLNPGDIVRRVTITGEALKDESGTEHSTGCGAGFVHRLATPSDHICVTPDEAATAGRQNALHVTDNLANLDGTCVEGFVWREATSGDHICVTPAERAEARQQNALDPERRAN